MPAEYVELVAVEIRVGQIRADFLRIGQSLCSLGNDSIGSALLESPHAAAVKRNISNNTIKVIFILPNLLF